MSQIPEWAGRAVTRARAHMVTKLPAPCGQCGETVTIEDAWVVGHIEARALHPELTWVPSNWRVEHRACSDATGNAIAQEVKARAGFFPTDGGRGQGRLPVHTHGVPEVPFTVREGLSWAELCQGAPGWLEPFLEVPEDAAPPLWVSSVHPDAVGSHGADAIAWLESNVRERGRPLRLRWWQRLAIALQLQHRADGSLCYRVILESGPRRIGKSVRLRGMALWRLQHGPTMFEPEQLVLHTGKDLAIVREVMRKAWPWAETRDEWGAKKGMTEPEVSYQEVNRWVARSKDSTTGYDACLALCDEAWNVPPASIDDDLEPTMLERASPQLVLTSTAHRRATSLMRGRIMDALATDDGETLMLIWAAPAGSDPALEETWRAASPHWSEDRRQMLASKYAKAEAGEEDPEADDIDPMSGFLAQYLNIWRLRDRKVQLGDPLTTPEDWQEITATPAEDVTLTQRPDWVAVESWPRAGVSVVAVWRLDDGRSLVSATHHPDAAEAAAAATAYSCRAPILAGASLCEDPAFKVLRTRPQKGAVVSAVSELARWLKEGALVHDGGQHLGVQVIGLRTKASSTGLRVVSTDDASAIKAAAWAIGAARLKRSGGTRILTASVP